MPYREARDHVRRFIIDGGAFMIKKEIVVNGIPRRLVVSGDDTLATVLRANLGLTGTKVGCGEGQCGACSVLIDGKVIAVMRHQDEPR